MAMEVFDAFRTLPEDTKNKLRLLGVGIGMIGYCFKTFKELSIERHNYIGNYLFELNKCVPLYMIERYANVHCDYHIRLNNELEHFIYD